MYLLDTNTVSEPARGHPDGRVLAQLEAHQHVLCTASVVIHELTFGVVRLQPGARRQALSRYLEPVVRRLPVLAYNQTAAIWHAQQRARLTALGLTPAFVDGQIAAIAATQNLIVVTRNTGDFGRFDGVAIENWFAP